MTKTIELTTWEQVVLTTRLRDVLAEERYRMKAMPEGYESSSIPVLERVLEQIAA